jgi:integrase
MRLWPKAIHRRIRFRDLPHSTATLLLRAGASPQHVQRILRHASINTTIGTYGHLIVEDLRASLAMLPDLAMAPSKSPEEVAGTGASSLSRTTVLLQGAPIPENTTAGVPEFSSEIPAAGRMSAEGIEPSTYGLRVHCSAN